MVSSDRNFSNHEAPGELERVRDLLNTWVIPNDTRRPTDLFDSYARRERLTQAQAGMVRKLRDDLRLAVERDPSAEDRINTWMRRVRVRVVLRDGVVVFLHNDSPAGELVGTVLRSVNDGTWERLKACPDCHWVFYDHSRNGSKRWCLMNAAGAGGRGCGTIAKVQRHRRARSQAGAAS